MNKKRVLQSIGVFVFFTFFITLLNLCIDFVSYDLIWCFHICQKVAAGIPLYEEIGTVVAPVFFWIGSLFIKLFGNYVTSIEIYSGVIAGGIATVIFNIIQETKKSENKYANYIFLFGMILILSTVALISYNSAAVFFVLLAVFFEVRREKKKISSELTKKKENLYNLLVGLFLGVAFFTKQNIGTYGVLATGVYSLIYKCFIKKQNAFKEIVLKASGFLLVLFVFVMHFVANGTFGSFINFCFGGLLEFGDKNLIMIAPQSYLIIVPVSVFTVMGMCKAKCEDAEVMVIEVLYLLFSMMLIYPLTNLYHAVLGGILVVPIFIIILDVFSVNKNIYNVSIAATLIFFIVFISSPQTVANEAESLYEGNLYGRVVSIIMIFAYIYFISFALSVIFDSKKIMKYTTCIGIVAIIVAEIFIYQYTLNSDKYLTENLQVYRGSGLNEKAAKHVDEVIEYIKMKEAEGYNVYVVSADASYYMAAMNRNQYKYDLTLYGSLGYDGENVLIEETKALENAIILKEEILMFQEPVEYDKFIKENYVPIDKIGSLIVYTREG